MKKIWTFEACKKEALKYDTRVAFQKNSSSAYQTACRNGYLNEICKHMNPLHKSWDKQSVLEEMSKFNTISKFQKASPGCYKAAVRLDLLYNANLPRISSIDRKMPLSEVKVKIFEIHGNTVILDESSYKGVSVRAKFIDKDYGEWWTVPRYVLGGKGHKIRGIEKQHQTCLQKYGTIHPIQNEKIKRKRDETIYIRYGVRNISNNSEIKKKKKETTRKNYGVDSPAQSELIKQKTKKTLLYRYGVESIAQNREIALRQARSSNKSSIKHHWKTNEELVCIGSYEAKTIDYLNSNRIEYDWQPKVFTMPDGRTYRPDLFLINDNKWVEIKGYFRKDAQEKWNWFRSENPTAELWDQMKLKSMEIL